MRTHTIPTASAMSRFYNCPASFKLSCSEIPNSSPQAEEGTLLHSVCEKSLSQNGFLDYENFKLDDEQTKAVEFCVEQILELIGRLKDNNTTFEILLEKRLIAASGKFSGQADVIILTEEGEAYVYDYKFGRGKVESAEENMQLATLAVLVFEHYKIDNITVGIIQPRALNRDSRVISAFYVYDDLVLAQKYINRTCDKITNGSTEQKVGHWCKYCPSSYRCAAVRAELESIRDIAIGSAHNAITTRNAKNIFIKAKQAESFCKDILGTIKQFVYENPEEKSGLKITNNVLKIHKEKTSIWS